jgi:hypothetical protein
VINCQGNAHITPQVEDVTNMSLSFPRKTSPTWGMAAFMDKFLLIVEAKKNNRDIIKRGYGKLVTERNNVAVVVNKARSYVPKLLDAES